MPKYFSSRNPEIDRIYQHLPLPVQEGISASHLPVNDYLYLFVDDPTVEPNETFRDWLCVHFGVKPDATGVLDGRDPIQEIYALDGSQEVHGTVPESDLPTLGKVALHST